MKEQQQGTMVDCVYCKYVHPELKGKSTCPVCRGDTPSFRPARMMDRHTSRRDVLKHLFSIQRSEKDEEFKNTLVRLLTRIDIYNFDLKEALIDQIRDLEEN